MIEKIDKSDLEFIEEFYNPVALAETLFSNFDNFGEFGPEFGHIRLGQLPLLSYEFLLDDEPGLNAKQNFRLREGAGNIWCLGGRRFGKTLIVEKIDLLLTFLLHQNEWIGFSSYDSLHIRGVLEDIITALENHPLLKEYKQKINRSPTYRIITSNNNVLESVNMNLQSTNPGAQFFQKHFTRLYVEEASFETEEIYRKRLDSISENGCVLRISGMTVFTKYSPCGKTFYDLSKKSWICNLPQYINPKWTEEEKQHAIKKHGGESSIGYRIFVKGEVVEEGISVFDMERIRKYYNEEKIVKTFEITKDNYFDFKSFISIERLKNADRVFIASDIGEAVTEIIILFEINNKFNYIYNIVLYNLTDKEQFRIFRWMGEKLQANFIGLDCTEGTGRAIFRSLEEVFSKENLIWVMFNEKIPIAFEEDESGNTVFKNGQPTYKEEYISEWSIKHLKDILYGSKIELPIDFKFDNQFNSVISTQSGPRTIYKCMTVDDHHFQAWQIFSIMHWYCEFILQKPISKKTFAKSGV